MIEPTVPSGPVPLLIEGLTPEQILALPRAEVDGFILCGRPLVFRAGSAEVLGQFAVVDQTLVAELGHIDGGGEGVLPALFATAARLARQRGLRVVDWRVYATRCPNPNLKLRRVTERRGFTVRTLPDAGECYHMMQSLD